MPPPPEDHPLPPPRPRPKPKPPKPRPKPETMKPKPVRDHQPHAVLPFPADPFACAAHCSEPCAHHHLCTLPPPSRTATVHLRPSSRLPTPLIALSASVLAVSVVLLLVLLACHVVRRRRRQGANAAPLPLGHQVAQGGLPADMVVPVPADVSDSDDGGVHHVWYIKTVGLDERAIAAITALVYDPDKCRALGLGGDGCAVCLAEFRGGETLRLLPRCGHAFHRGCIDTWLRAHVNCPLCRSDVVDPAAAAAGVGIESNPPADPDVSANAAAEQAAAASGSTLEREDEEEDQEAPRLEEGQHEQQPSSPEPEPLPQLPGPLPRNVRRAASMNAAMVSTAADVAALDRQPDAAPEGEEQNGREKHQSGATGHPSSERPAPGGLPRSFFSRHCRARSSVLPL